MAAKFDAIVLSILPHCFHTRVTAKDMGKASTYIHYSDDPRAKLLNRLGIYPRSPLEIQRTRKHILRQPLARSTATLLGGAVPIREPLNDTNYERISKRTRIQFNDDVMVVHIPSRHEYSDRIRRFLWSDSFELRELVERNRVEYASEGWDWHAVLEDDDMYVDSNTGELVHPCWFEDEEIEVDAEEEIIEDDFLDVERPILLRSNTGIIGLDQLADE